MAGEALWGISCRGGQRLGFEHEPRDALPSPNINMKPDKESIAPRGSSPADGSSARIFISYSRKCGDKFAANLRDKLVSQQLSVWQDIIALEGGRDWWSQIEEVIRAKTLEHFVLVVTPA